MVLGCFWVVARLCYVVARVFWWLLGCLLGVARCSGWLLAVARVFWVVARVLLGGC